MQTHGQHLKKKCGIKSMHTYWMKRYLKLSSFPSHLRKQAQQQRNNMGFGAGFMSYVCFNVGPAAWARCVGWLWPYQWSCKWKSLVNYQSRANLLCLKVSSINGQIRKHQSNRQNDNDNKLKKKTKLKIAVFLFEFDHFPHWIEDKRK